VMMRTSHTGGVTDSTIAGRIACMITCSIHDHAAMPIALLQCVLSACLLLRGGICLQVHGTC
jgi:hypothetical protein